MLGSLTWEFAWDPMSFVNFLFLLLRYVVTLSFLVYV